MSSRIDALRGMLDKRPQDSRLRFGLALEYLNAGRIGEAVSELRAYLDQADDEGNAWGRLGDALDRLGRRGEAVEAYRRGIETALRHGHPSMAEEFEDVLRGWGV